MLAKRASPDRPVRPDGGIWKLFLCTDDAAGSQPQAIVGWAEWVADPEFLEQLKITISFVKDPDGYLLELGQLPI